MRYVHLFFFLIAIFIPLLSIATQTYGHENDLISSLTITKNRISIGIHEDFKKKYLTDDFFVEYDHDIDVSKLPYEIITMPFLMNVISIVWISGKNYSIDSMDQDLYHSLQTIKKIYKHLYPRTPWNGNLIPKKLVPTAAKRITSNKKALLFSGGLDSTSSFFEHVGEDLILITAQGQYDLPLKNEALWQLRKSKIMQFARSYSKPCSFIRSNYSEFLNWNVLNRISPEIDNWRVNTVEGVGWAGLVAPICATKKCSVLYIPSSICWHYPYIYCAHPFVDNSIVCAGYHLIHDQFDLMRHEKSEFIALSCKNNPGKKKPYIKSCQRTRLIDDSNCCSCNKCLVTILSFILLGEDPKEYGFDISLEDAFTKTLTLFSSQRLDHFTHWNFKMLQDAFHRTTLQKKDGMQKFLSFDLKKVPVYDQKYTRKINWNALQKLAPEVEASPSNASTLLGIV